MDKQEDQKQAIIQQLRVIFRAIQAHSRKVEKVCGLSSAQLWMLYEVSLSDGIKVSELASILSIHRSTSSNMLDKLENKNLIYRNRSASDQRSVHIHITTEGEALLTKAPSPPRGHITDTLARLTDKQLAALETSLQPLISALHFEEVTAKIDPISEEKSPSAKPAV